MTVTAASFRDNYPEFSDVNLYPPSAINYWRQVGEALLRSDIWTTMQDLGVELFIAHNLVLEARAQSEATNGAPPGMSTGPKSAESVDKVSVSYDTAAGIVANAGHWNLTTFGARLIDLMRKFGAMPIQVGVSYDASYSAAAWPGPIFGA